MAVFGQWIRTRFFNVIELRNHNKNLKKYFKSGSMLNFGTKSFLINEIFNGLL